MMTGSDVTSRLPTEWINAVELGLEAGRSPLLALGVGIDLLGNLPALVAFHAFARQRRDLTAPTVVIGGPVLLWLAGLMHEMDTAAPTTVPMTVVYGGPDRATQTASGSILASATEYNELARGPDWGLTAEQQTGRSLWASPLLWLIEGSAPPADVSPPPSTADHWLAWAGSALTIILIALAILF
jgi:hypothetical protein